MVKKGSIMSKKPLVSFDYAIKYLLKDKGDHEIIEGFISALLKSQGYKAIKIIGLLDTESNKEDEISKRSLADLIVEDIDHNKYIVEIERNLKHTFLHKACFNTSRLIVDNLAQRVDYTQILKIFHITLLYFPFGNTPIHHAKTIFQDAHSSEAVNIQIRDRNTKEILDLPNIFPEYFFISIPLFNDKLEKEIDDWLYVMKHDEIPPLKDFHSPYMAKVEEKLSILKMTPDQRQSHIAYLKKIYSDRDSIEAAEQKGKLEGKLEGKQEALKTLFQTMLQNGADIATISKLSNISIDQIQKILN